MTIGKDPVLPKEGDEEDLIGVLDEQEFSEIDSAHPSLLRWDVFDALKTTGFPAPEIKVEKKSGTTKEPLYDDRLPAAGAWESWAHHLIGLYEDPPGMDDEKRASNKRMGTSAFIALVQLLLREAEAGKLDPEQQKTLDELLKYGEIIPELDKYLEWKKAKAEESTKREEKEPVKTIKSEVVKKEPKRSSPSEEEKKSSRPERSKIINALSRDGLQAAALEIEARAKGYKDSFRPLAEKEWERMSDEEARERAINLFQAWGIGELRSERIPELARLADELVRQYPKIDERDIRKIFHIWIREAEEIEKRRAGSTEDLRYPAVEPKHSGLDEVLKRRSRQLTRRAQEEKEKGK